MVVFFERDILSRNHKIEDGILICVVLTTQDNIELISY